MKYDFYNKAKQFLKEKAETKLCLSGKEDRSEPKQVTKWEHQVIIQKTWACRRGKFFTGNSKKVMSKRNCFKSCPTYTVEFLREDTSMKKWLQEIMHKSARKLLTHLSNCAYSMRRKWPLVNGSSNIPLFDRDRLNGKR